MENKKRVIAQGILGIFLVATFFSCGCIDTPTPEIVEVEKMVEVEKIVYIDNFDEGCTKGWNDMVLEHNEIIEQTNKDWKKVIEERDELWGVSVKNAYTKGWNDANDNMLSDTIHIVKELTPILKWIPI